MSRPESRESAVVDLAAVIVKTTCFLLAGNVPSAVLSISDLLQGKVKGTLEQRRIERIFAECGDIIARQLLGVLQLEFRNIPENERVAVILAVRDTFIQGNMTLRKLVQADLNAHSVEHSLRGVEQQVLPAYLLSADALELYRLVRRECCAYLVEAATTFPQFQAEALQQLLSRETRLTEILERVLGQLPQRRGADAFEEDYCRVVTNKLDRMELFGISNLMEPSRTYPLSVAYVSLTTLNWNETERTPQSTGVRIERALAGQTSVLIVGDAGSGKTTILKWLAVAAARSDFDDPLMEWNNCVPFIISLRRYPDGNLPESEHFIDEVARNLGPDMPKGWVNELLRSGRALVLVDGIDELQPGRPRVAAQYWLSELISDFPEARYIVTSRPTAVEKEWPVFRDFVGTELQAMSSSDVKVFSAQWHAAMARRLDRQEDRDRLPGDQRSILAAIEADRHLRALAVNPLLCAMLCALNREWNRKLPRERMDIYEAALNMLLGGRDRARGVDTAVEISPANQTYILQELSLWLVINGWSDAPRKRMQERIDYIVRSLPRVKGNSEELLRYLLERSGLLRESTAGRIDFIHRTFQEYLAGKAAVDTDQTGQLINQAHNDQWHEVVVMAAGHARPLQCVEIIRGVLARAADEPKYRSRLRLVALACMQTARQLDPVLKIEVENVARDLIPPRDNATAEQLAVLGDHVIDVLADNLPEDPAAAVACVRSAALIGTTKALELIGLIVSIFPVAREEALRSWRFFDTSQYARIVLKNVGPVAALEIEDTALISGLRHMQGLKKLAVYVSAEMESVSKDLDGLSNVRELEQLYIDCGMHNVQLGGLNKCDSLQALSIRQARCWRLNELLIRRPPLLAELRITDCNQLRNLEGLEAWNGLTTVEIIRCSALTDISAISNVVTLENILLDSANWPDLSPVKNLPALRELRLIGSLMVNLTALKGVGNIRILIPQGARVRGEELLGHGSVIVRVPF